MKKFRVATSGATIDGREIKAEWLAQAAKNYNPDFYTARINCDHYSGWGLDKDGRFGSFGTVMAMTAEVNKAGKTELFAEIELNARGKAAIKDDQKVFTSIEVWPEFADTGEAYVSGLAMTDTPASLGTQRLTFSAQPADATVQAPVFSAIAKTGHGAQAFAQLHPVTLAESEGQNQPEAEQDITGIRAQFTSLRESFAAKFAGRDKSSKDMAIEVEKTLNALGNLTVSRLEVEATRADQLAEDFAALQAAMAGEFQQLKSSLEKQEGTPPRPTSIGGTGQTAYDAAPY